MLTRRYKLGALLVAVLFAMGLFVFPLGVSADNNYVPNPGFEDASPEPIPGSNLQDYGIGDNDIRIYERAYQTNQTNPSYLRIYTYDSPKAYKAKFVGVDGANYNGASVSSWRSVFQGNYFEIPMPELTIVPGTTYSVSFRALVDNRANEGGEAQLVARVVWNSDTSLGQFKGFSQGTVNSVNHNPYGWKIPGLVSGSTMNIVTYSSGGNAAVEPNTTTKLQFFFSKINRSASGEDGTTRTMIFDDIYVAPTTTSDGVAIPMAVIGSTPADLSTVTGPISSVTVNFNYKVDMSTLTPANISVTGATIAETNGIVMAPDAMSATINFAAPVESGSVSVSLSDGINDWFGKTGRSLLTPKTITFNVEEGATPPLLVSADPENGATGVPVDTSVRLTFSKALNPATVNETYITTDDATIADINLENEDRDIVITFDGDLENEKEHTITLSGIESAEGIAIEEPITYTFTTVSATVPEVVQVWPADGEKRVYRQPTVNLLFSLPVNVPTKASGIIKINGDTALINSILDDPTDATRLSVRLNALELNTTYTVTVNGATTTDGAPVAPFTSTFTTTMDDRVNLFANPGFEAKKSGFDSMKNSITSDDPYSGAYAVYSSNAGGEDWINMSNGFAIGKTYGISAFFKNAPVSTNDSGGVRANVRAVYTSGSYNQEWYSRLNNLNKADGYQRFAFSYYYPQNPNDATVNGKGMVLAIPPQASIKYYMDDLEIYEIPKDLDITEEGTIYDGAQLESPDDELIIAFNREMMQDLAPSQIKIDGVPVAAVTPHENSVMRFIITPAQELALGNEYTVTIEDAEDIYGCNSVPQDTPGGVYNGSFTFTVGEPTLDRYTFDSFKIYADGEESGTIQANAVMKASVVGLTNNTGAAGGAYLITALFKDGLLVSTNLANVSLGDGETAAQPLEASITAPDLADGAYEFKAFLWEDLIKLIPIAKLSVGE